MRKPTLLRCEQLARLATGERERGGGRAQQCQGFARLKQTLAQLTDGGAIPALLTRQVRIGRQRRPPWGSASACVRVSRQGRTLTLQVEDGGRGFPRGAVSARGEPLAHMGVGIAGIQERLRQIGGTLSICSRRKKTVVTATIPLDRTSPR